MHDSIRQIFAQHELLEILSSCLAVRYEFEFVLSGKLRSLDLLFSEIQANWGEIAGAFLAPVFATGSEFQVELMHFSRGIDIGKSTIEILDVRPLLQQRFERCFDAHG